MSFINKIQKFMIGRYGPDEFYHFLFKIYILLIIINLFLSNYIISILELGILIFMFYRFFSKNCYQRRKENRKFLEFQKILVYPFLLLKRNIKDKDHVYKKCSKCKTTLKLPVPMKRGIQHAKCPNCYKRLTILTFKQQKIEIIKKNSR